MSKSALDIVMRSAVSQDSSEVWLFWRSDRIFSSPCPRKDWLLLLIEGLSDFSTVAFLCGLSFLLQGCVNNLNVSSILNICVTFMSVENMNEFSYQVQMCLCKNEKLELSHGTCALSECALKLYCLYHLKVHFTFSALPCLPLSHWKC